MATAPVIMPLSIRFTPAEANMLREIRALAKAQKRSVSEQIKYLAYLGMAARDNPDLPLNFIEGILEGLAELDAGLGVPYEFGVLKDETAKADTP